jgi:hypothetical protein
MAFAPPRDVTSLQAKTICIFLSPRAGRGRIALAIRVRGLGNESERSGNAPSSQPSPRKRGEGVRKRANPTSRVRGLGHLRNPSHQPPCPNLSPAGRGMCASEDGAIFPLPPARVARGGEGLGVGDVVSSPPPRLISLTRSSPTLPTAARGEGKRVYPANSARFCSSASASVRGAAGSCNTVAIWPSSRWVSRICWPSGISKTS